MATPSERQKYLEKLEKLRAKNPERKARFETSSGIELPALPPERSHPSESADPELGLPGEFPFTRGVQPNMYRGRLWTMRQYAGFGTAEESNRRYRYLLSQGTTGLSVAFDLPTQMGLDSDDSRALGEVGKVGVAIDTVEDMAVLFNEIPLDRVSTSMTINAPALLLLGMYVIVAERQGVPSTALNGTIQNDILKEYIARGTFIFPPRPSMRLITDTFAFCAERVPQWNTISISGYHIREAGSTAAQEIAFTLADGIAYVEAALAAGLKLEQFAGRLSFFFNAHNNFFEEIAKYRAARRLWAHIMRDRFGATDPRACMLRFHTQTGGSTLTAQQVDNNVVRVTLQALAAVMGGTQSLHTNSRDEALGLPTSEAAKLALRTQQVIAYESGVADSVDPLAGSHLVEHLTDQLEALARGYIDRIDALGGMIPAIEHGFPQREIQDAAYRAQLAIDKGTDVVVGVNKFVEAETVTPEILRVDPDLERAQVERVRALRAARREGVLETHRQLLIDAARGGTPLGGPGYDALRAGLTLGEICNALRTVFGQYHEPVFL